MSKAGAIIDPTVAARAAAEDAAVDELRALAGLMMARAEDAAADPLAVVPVADSDAAPVVAPLFPVKEREVARADLRRAEAAWMCACGRLAAARVAWKLAISAAATRALAGFLAGLRMAPRGRRRQRRRAAARKSSADPPGGSWEAARDQRQEREGRRALESGRPPKDSQKEIEARSQPGPLRSKPGSPSVGHIGREHGRSRPQGTSSTGRKGGSGAAHRGSGARPASHARTGPYRRRAVWCERRHGDRRAPAAIMEARPVTAMDAAGWSKPVGARR